MRVRLDSQRFAVRNARAFVRAEPGDCVVSFIEDTRLRLGVAAVGVPQRYQPDRGGATGQDRDGCRAEVFTGPDERVRRLLAFCDRVDDVRASGFSVDELAVGLALTSPDAAAVQARALDDARWLRELQAQGKLIASGPFVPREGGALLLRVENESEIQPLVANDPFQIEGLVDTTIYKWAPNIGVEGLDSLGRKEAAS